MRLLLFFDLPTLTNEHLKDYRKFVKNLKKEGFYMIQESVYVKMVLNNNAANSMKNRIREILPSEGNVLVLIITEKQFSNMDVILGNIKTDVVNDVDKVIKL